MKNLLLLSNSRMPTTGYLQHALAPIAETLGAAKKIVLVPYASVAEGDAWDATLHNVQQALSSLELEISAIHHHKDSAKALSEADAIMVNGGNTFQLLHQLRKRELIVPLRRQMLAGKTYVGWSAGSVICAPSIRTTNDMPIIDPAGLDALGLINFQLNAHYSNAVPEGWMGETRDQRLAEFVAVNPTVPVLGLPEGDWLRVRGDAITLHGPFAATWFRAGRLAEAVESNAVVEHQP